MEPTQQTPYVYTSNQSSSGSNFASIFKNPKVLAIVGVAIVAAALLAVVLWKASGSGGVDLEHPAASVTIKPEGFEPATIKIKSGEDVAWVNRDENVHQVFADQAKAPGLDSAEPLARGDTYIFTFDKPGTYNYYDPLNPTQLSGTVVVE